MMIQKPKNAGSVPPGSGFLSLNHPSLGPLMLHEILLHGMVLSSLHLRALPQTYGSSVSALCVHTDILKDAEKLKARAARFGAPQPAAAGQKRSAPTENIDPEEAERRRKRAERFGTSDVVRIFDWGCGIAVHLFFQETTKI